MNFVENVVLRAKIGDCPILFVPKYLNCNDWNNDFDKLKNCMADVDINFCIVGDLNARTGCMQTIDNNLLLDCPIISPTRISCDKTIDRRGRKLLELLEDIGGVILNGRTK